MKKVKQPVSIDGIEFDALIDESQEFEVEVPEYATEEGFSVTDSMILKAETLSLTLYVTDTPVTWRKRHHPGPGRVESVIKQLEKLYYAKKLVTVVTADKVYEDMALTNLTISKSTDIGYAREIPITVKKINVTKNKTVTIPAKYGRSGATKAPTGTSSSKGGSTSTKGGTSSDSSKKTSGNSSGKSGSILYKTAESMGLIK